MKKSPQRTRLDSEPLEDRPLLSAAPILQMTYATTTDAQTISINYTISGTTRGAYVPRSGATRHA
jgi:hypothetical protein